MDRWTIADLKARDNLTFAIDILNERRMKVSRYSPLGTKLAEAAYELGQLRDKLREEPEEPDVSKMTEAEYAAHRIEQSRRAIMALIAKVERPDGDKLSDILVRAVNEIEALQAEGEARE